MDWPFLIGSLLLLFGLLLGGIFWMSRMPGRSFQASAPQYATPENDLRQRLKNHVFHLAETIGERNIWRPQALTEAADYIAASLSSSDLSVVIRTYEIKGQTVGNVETTLLGESDDIILVGAHYDTVPGCPGANDNGSGVAVLIELARMLANVRPQKTIRLVAFVNEEPPFFKTDRMGSRVYVRQSRERSEKIVAMLSLETLGYYSQSEDSQAFPLPLIGLFYPDRGNFVAFVSNLKSRKLLHRVVAGFRESARIPSEGLAAPGWVTGVDWSDQWSFWQEGIPAVMVTDTAPFRDPYYHSPGDTSDRLQYRELALVTEGLARAVASLAGTSLPQL